MYCDIGSKSVEKRSRNSDIAKVMMMMMMMMMMMTTVAIMIVKVNITFWDPVMKFKHHVLGPCHGK